MAEETSNDEVERLLSGRTRDIRLAGPLAKRFRDRSFKQTAKIIRSWMLWVILLDALAMGTNILLLPAGAAYPMLFPSLIIPPAALFVYWVWRRQRSDLFLNGSLVLGMTAILLSVCLMGAAAGAEFYERYLSIMLFVSVAGIIIFNVPAITTQAIAAVALGLYLAFQLGNPEVSTSSAVSAFLFFASGVAATVVARRTMTILAHRTFLLELRDAHRVDELARANERLDILSRTDALTKLPNRRDLERMLDTLRFPDALSGGIAMLMCDIDCFKALNDERGHAVGDRCLAEVARIIRESMPANSHYVARYGGEEFLVILTGDNSRKALELSEAIRSKVEAERLQNPRSSVGPWVTLSIGVAVSGVTAAQSPEGLMRAADLALYAAKKSGRNRVAEAHSSFGSDLNNVA
ncbi:GGDEF domain-containing protein [Devosia sp. RR2S18]|uniref:GGDEF domain-containing protein n=1 Tax=Devosia rhizosphaerae TaxID=3049774 RepID=UPI0025403B93|nr:GGDEF domain-containing protein [Devosia sp. RR2S18]WIJ25882.1 GGDEF domain-containing protein [Devosia sp. RR2S18]